MSITSRCTECGSESSGTGGIVHATTCSAVSLTPKLRYGQMAPAIELKFGSKAEQKKFMRNLKKGSIGGTSLVATDSGKNTAPVESAPVTPNPIKDDLRKKSQDFAIHYYEALADDAYKRAEKLTLEHLALIAHSNQQLLDRVLAALPEKKQEMLNGKALVHHNWYNTALDQCKRVIEGFKDGSKG